METTKVETNRERLPQKQDAQGKGGSKTDEKSQKPVEPKNRESQSRATKCECCANETIEPTREMKKTPTPTDQQDLSSWDWKPPVPERPPVQPTFGEVITSRRTGNTYTIGEMIGEGGFGVVYSCTDSWANKLAVKVLKGQDMSYDETKCKAEAEFEKLVALRHPCITYVYDAFECRDTFYIVTELCLGPVHDLLTFHDHNSDRWLMRPRNFFSVKVFRVDLEEGFKRLFLVNCGLFRVRVAR